MIYEKLQQARVRLQEMNLTKSGKNAFANSKYFELADFLPAVNKIFLELHLCSNFSIADNLATLQIIDFEDNSTITFTSPVETLDLKGCNKIQALGGIHTYLKRYLYVNALEIVENDMFDATISEEKSKTVTAVKEVSKGKEIEPEPQIEKNIITMTVEISEINDILELKRYKASKKSIWDSELEVLYNERLKVLKGK